MKKLRTAIAVLLCAWPIATIAVCAAFRMDPARLDAPQVASWAAVAGSVTAVLALLLVVVLFAFFRAHQRVLGEMDSFRDLDRERARRVRDLQGRVDFLSAIREASIIVNQDVEPEALLAKLLEVASYVVGNRTGDVITVYEWGGEKLEPVARRQGKECRFGKALAEVRADRHDVQEAYMEGRLYATGDEEGALRLVMPMSTDRQIVGVLEVETTVDGAPEDRAERRERLRAQLPEFASCLAVGLKTKDLYTRTIQDGLTGLYSKRHFLSEVRKGFEEARREGSPLSLVMIDIDHFKAVNDTHGHLTGDVVLKEVATIVKEGVRSYQYAFRYGGEEIAILFTRAPADKAQAAAERLRKKIEARKFTSEKGVSFRLTASFGVAEHGAGTTSPEEILQRADDALYWAKHGGRNQVRVWTPEAEAACRKNA